MFLGMLMAFVLMMIASPALEAQTNAPPSEADILAVLKKEPPLTQEEIDIFIKIAPALKEADNKDKSKLPSIFKEAGLSDIRGIYVMFKVAGAMANLVQGVPLNQIPELHRPTPQEVELVKKNQAALTKLIPQPK